MNTAVKNSELPGPPFYCPECAGDGKNIHFNKRQHIATHRMSHGVAGNSTGSKAYRQGSLSYSGTLQKKAKKGNQVKRTYAPRQPKNILFELVNNPNSIVREIDEQIAAKQIEIDNLEAQIQELKQNISTMNGLRNKLFPQGAEPTKMYEHTA